MVNSPSLIKQLIARAVSIKNIYQYLDMNKYILRHSTHTTLRNRFEKLKICKNPSLRKCCLTLQTLTTSNIIYIFSF